MMRRGKLTADIDKIKMTSMLRPFCIKKENRLDKLRRREVKKKLKTNLKAQEENLNSAMSQSYNKSKTNGNYENSSGNIF